MNDPKAYSDLEDENECLRKALRNIKALATPPFDVFSPEVILQHVASQAGSAAKVGLL